MNKEYYVFVEGKKVIVTEEVYRAYMQPVWREERNARNRWKCRTASGIRCTRNCETCEIWKIGSGATGNDLSLERMVEDEDPEFAKVPDVADMVILNEDLLTILEEIRKMNETSQTIISLLTEGYSQHECATKLGMSQQAVSKNILAIRKKLKKFLK